MQFCVNFVCICRPKLKKSTIFFSSVFSYYLFCIYSMFFRGKRKQKAVAHCRTAIDTIPMDVNPNANNFEHNHISNMSRLTTRNYSDMLIVQSTLPGHVSYRDRITGSWFIHYLCSTFMNYACTTHIQDLFTMVNIVILIKYKLIVILFLL